ncbi:hypothetical protein I316_01599 [Kwoniella heveanensis BCC8398]|uniref:Selenoprotein W n=1 Tax=Kwoniella heveanensis BCC8398 TaxID=1296120 RepID=A0A1B9GZ97_9TREE|nr:hypothetical protein I316_01599 [Kwoniella heveanensis BCC8398]
MAPPVCEDCDQPIPQPASGSAMAHDPSESPEEPHALHPHDSKPSTSTGTASESGNGGGKLGVDVFPAPVDPPKEASHKTELTYGGPPTPTLDGRPGHSEADTQPQAGVESGLHEKQEKEKDGKHSDNNDSNDKEHGSKQEGAKVQEGTTFQAPLLKDFKPSVIIEFCDRCRWAPRATWIQTELFLTFPNPLIRTITLIPLNAPETGGRFRVWVDKGDGVGEQLAWDRKTEGGFPELKVLKQRIRNIIQPEMGLGHSDAHAHKA